MNARIRGTVAALAVVAAPVAVILTGNTGCGASPAADESSDVSDDGASFPASAETTAALGVTRWQLDAQTNETRAAGFDANGAVRIRFRFQMRAAGGVVETAGTTSAVMRFSIANGEYSMLENQFLDRPEALKAIERVTADLRASAQNGETHINTASLKPLGGSNLVGDGGDLVFNDGGIIVHSDGGVSLTDGGAFGLTNDTCNKPVKGAGVSCNSVYRQSTADCLDMSARRCGDLCYNTPEKCGSCKTLGTQCDKDWEYYRNLGCNKSCNTEIYKE